MNLLETILTAVLSLWLGSMEYRMRKVRDEGNDKVNRNDVSELIDLKQEASQVRHKELKEDVVRLETKIDKLIDMQLK